MGSNNTGVIDERAPLAGPDEMDTVGNATAATGQGPQASGAPSPEPTFDDELRAALREDRLSGARTLVANAEAVLAAHEAAGNAETPPVSRVDLAAAKARVAMATGDGPAARAILVQAIEMSPKSVPLRTLMTEVMLATGRAADIRPVLHHLGKAPTKRDVDLGKNHDKTGDSSG
ncbi:MAG TPA: hypothetical protein EYP31_01290 [Roseibacterium sp.]|nr:hypothetical protein [Roseibacterium sp.]